MRWKLVVIASLIAGLVGTGAMLGIIFFWLGSTQGLAKPGLAASVALVTPLLLIAGAGVFVYRHTARRRKTQAMATVLLSTIMTLTLMFLSMMFLSNSTEEQPVPQPRKMARLRPEHK